MSILEKLKDLVKAIELESEEIQEDPNPEVGPEEPDVVEEEILKEEQDSVEEPSDYLECDEEESLEVFKLMEDLKAQKESLADLVLLYEKKRETMTQVILEKRASLYSKLDSLRLDRGLSTEGYVVQLPTSLSEKVIFKIKQED